MQTPVSCQKRLQWAPLSQKWTMMQWKKVAWSDGARYLSYHVDVHKHVRWLPGGKMVPWCKKASWRRKHSGDYHSILILMLWLIYVYCLYDWYYIYNYCRFSGLIHIYAVSWLCCLFHSLCTLIFEHLIDRDCSKQEPVSYYIFIEIKLCLQVFWNHFAL